MIRSDHQRQRRAAGVRAGVGGAALPLEVARELQERLDAGDLARVVEIYGLLARTPPGVVAGYLRVVFRAAEQTGVRLGTPELEHEEQQLAFVGWLSEQLWLRLDGKAAKANTMLGRYQVLLKLYGALQLAGLLPCNPLLDIDLPASERSYGPLPTQGEFERLLMEVGGDALLQAAVLLLYEQALRPGEALFLEWSQVDFTRQELLRRTGTVKFSPRVARGLEALAARAGGALFARGKLFAELLETAVKPPEDELRSRLWQACQACGVPYVAPLRMRLAGLRDFEERFDFLSAGYHLPAKFQASLALAAQVSRAPAGDLDSNH